MNRYFLVLCLLFFGSGCDHSADQRHSDNDTAMHNAVRSCDVRKLEELRKSGVDLNTTGAGDKTLLHLAIDTVFPGDKEKRLECVKYLLEHNVDINAKDGLGATPLRYAMLSPQTEITVFFIENHANVRERDDHEKTPLHWAMDGGYNLPVVRSLIQHGADVHASDNGGETPLHRAAAHNPNLEILKTLLEHGANINARDNLGNTPLHTALASPYFCIDDGFSQREHRAQVYSTLNVHYQSGDHLIPYINIRTIKFLVERGADIHAVDHEGRTPLHIAASKCLDPDVLKYLLAQGANPNAKDPWGRTPLDSVDTDAKEAILLEAMKQKTSVFRTEYLEWTEDGEW